MPATGQRFCRCLSRSRGSGIPGAPSAFNPVFNKVNSAFPMQMQNHCAFSIKNRATRDQSKNALINCHFLLLLHFKNIRDVVQMHALCLVK
jgi:hypothetical protein